jgi:predicted AAA+ superfamily ATPase
VIERQITKIVKSALGRSPAVALMGPRQVGKTTLALQIADGLESVYLDLENRLDLSKVVDITAFHEENRDKLIILDEVQRMPELFREIRGIIDQERRRGKNVGQFLFLGSASIDLLRQSSESLAGRIAYLELFPINVTEFAKGSAENLNSLWLRGGFPESLLAATDIDSFAWRQDFIRTYLERDIPQLGARVPATTLERFWTMLCHQQGTMLNASNIARSLEMSVTSIVRYLDLMCDLLLVRRLQPWASNAGKRMVRTPKVYVRDSGMVHALLQIESYNDLLGHPVSGGSWEGFVIENMASVIPATAKLYFYRSSGGAEIDLVLELSAKERWAIEIKRNSAPSISKGFHIGSDDIKATRKYVVYAGLDQFPMGDGVTAISLSGLMEEVGKLK